MQNYNIFLWVFTLCRYNTFDNYKIKDDKECIKLK